MKARQALTIVSLHKRSRIQLCLLAMTAGLALPAQVCAQTQSYDVENPAQPSWIETTKLNNPPTGPYDPTSPYGAWVHAALYSGGSVEGELLAVESKRVWIRLAGGTLIKKIPLTKVGSIRMQRHELSARQIGGWVLVAGLFTTAGMTVACSEVRSDGCLPVALAIMGSWAVVWGISALLIQPSKKIWPSSENWNVSTENLSAYARFPLGLPDGFILPESSWHREDETINPVPAEKP